MTTKIEDKCKNCDNVLGDCAISRDCGECIICCKHSTCEECNRGRNSRSQRSTTKYVQSCIEYNSCSDCELCENHCGCIHCGNCSRVTEHTCVHCNYCERCCNCDICGDCGEDRNEGNCTCMIDEMNDRNPGAPFRAISKNELTLFDCARLVGVELEYNDVADADALMKWEWQWRAGDHQDGSCGREVVTAPIAGNHLVNCLTSLGVALDEAGAKADESCGIHVHVD